MASSWNEADIAVIGMAGRFPGADDIGELWRNLRDAVSSVRDLSDQELLAAGVDPAQLANPNLVKVVAMPRGIDRFDATFFGFSHREAEVMDPQQRLLLECSWQALEDAGYVGESYPGPIGVFAGVSTSTYLLYQVMANPAVVATLDPLHIDLGNSGDYLTTRISHKLNLTGPSFLVQCACSTGLVAVHAACQSLLAEECDMALAGSGSINVGQLRGYLYQEGGIVSPDGCCRTFDARARGSIVGSGLGMVVLKRLAEAVADGDTIRAVIKGSAINNDGALKVGYTAPSVEGQARVIAEALARSGVEPWEISYVEAHGSGTALGDPIEVEALKRAFDGSGSRNGNGRRALCALGSVKTNVGHLATAAGITGLIKTVLSLEHGMIPPSLHFERANPEIEFGSSPFYVNVELSPWERNSGPRRAGVSAFGFGGTNAHVVLEEAPVPVPPPPSARPHQLLLLSAKSAGALDAATARLAGHLRDHPELDLADVAYTLQRGRKAFGHRRSLACRDREEAVALLFDPTSEGVFTGAVQPAQQGVAFLFPGLGDQHLHMAAGLYAAEPVFHAEIDRSCELLKRSLGVDLREVLYPARRPGEAGESRGGVGPGLDLRRRLGRSAETAETAGEASRRLDRTLFAQPATFVVEHALARLWMDWGIEPQAMIGYSLGEYTAACIAGVLGLEEALWLVAERARLIEELPAGAMLAVPLPESEVADRLGPELSLAAVNAPQICVLAGSESAVAELEQELAQRGVASRRLRTSHAFHSRQMEPVAERLVECVERLALKAPRIPYLSNVTGTWITGREATDPRYWGRHLCEPVRFSAGLGALLAGPGRFLLEVGPGQALSTCARQHPAAGGATVVPCLGEGGGAGADQAMLMRAVGRLWLAGVEVDGARFFRHERRRRVPLPTYPFERQRYWIEASRESALARPSAVLEQAPPDAAIANSLAAVTVLPMHLSEHPRPALRNAYVAPRDAAERQVAAIWQKLLGVDEVGVHDDFFELGGHSFLTTVLVTELRQSFGVDIGIRELFERPTVAGFAAAIAAIAAAESRVTEAAVPPAALPQVVPDPASRHQPFPLTEVQQAYLIGRGDAFALGQVSTHAYAEVDGRGIDLGRLTHAFRFLIARHDMLRAVVHADGRQEILAAVPPYEIAVLDLRGSGEEAAAAALLAIRRKMSHQVLPSHRWPLYELRATLLDGGRVRLHLSFDFLIGDAWSLQVLLPELALAYHGRESELPALSLSFRDYVVATAGLEEWPAFERAAAYWTDRLAGFPLAPELALAVDPESVRRPTFVRHPGRLATASWQRAKERAARNGLTPSGLLLAAFAEVLTVWSKSPRFAINLTLFNRLPLHAEVNHLVGDFTSLSLLAIDNYRPGPFGERAQRVQKQLFEDLDHSAWSGIRMLRELARRQGGQVPAMMPVVFTSTLTQISPREALAGLGEAELGFVISQTPQVWLDHQVLEDPQGLSYSWDVVEELFPPGMIAEMLASYQALLERLAGEEPVWEELRPVGPPARQLALFAAANATAGPVPEGLLHAPFAAQALRCPERVAVVAGDLALSYGELSRRANALARRLRALGAEPGSLVAVVMEKGWEQVVGVLAVLLSGAAYLPVDPELPRARRFYLFGNGGVSLALTQPHLATRLDWPDEVRWLAVSGALAEEEEADDGRPLPALQGPRDLAYVIYTSGSTGEPKGVMIDHQGALNTVVYVDERFGVGPQDRVLALSALSFDLSVYDVFGLLAAGGTVVLPEAGHGREPRHWAELLDRHRVTVWNTVPALMEMLADFGEVTGYRAPSLRLAMLSGDWISLRLPARIGELSPGAEVVSLGGATEASIWSILFPVGEVSPGWRSVPYGWPMRNQTFHVLDGDLAPRPVGVPGQLYIGGIGLARGYWRDPAKTARSFVAAPWPAGRLYRTGDLGRYLPDGTIEFLGREDFQVKVGGFRIELGEIEEALARHPSVRETLVLAPVEEPGSRRLVAYVVPAGGSSPGPAELRAFLGEQLPAYMVPADFVVLAAFPLTANGKVDRQALPLPQGAGEPAESAYTALRGPIEELLAGFFAEVLKVERVGSGDDFFALGGNSLLAAQVTSRLRAGFGVELPLGALFEKPTAGELARVVERQMSAGDGPEVALPPLLPRPPGSAPEGLPLSFSQQRLWFLDRFQPGSPLYNIPLTVRMKGALSVRTAERCLAEIERRHEVLRSVFVAGEDATPVQLVRPPAMPPLPLVDLTGLGSDRSSSDGLGMDRGSLDSLGIDRGLGPAEALALGPGGLASQEVRRSFDLARGPLWRGLLLRLGPEDHLLLLTVHHIVSDGWSQGILMGELQALYSAFSADLPSPLPELPVQYADFALWQSGWLQGEVLEHQLTYWKRLLAGAPPVLDLPADRPRPAVATSAGATLAWALPDALARQLEALSRRAGATLFMTLLAAFQALLGRYSGQEDVVVGTPVAGRNHVLTEGLIGFFVNNLAVRTRLAGAADFLELLARVREGTLLAFAHQELPFEKLVGELQMERDLSHAPVFQVVFALQNAPFPPRGIPGLGLEPVVVETGTAKFDLAVALEPIGGRLTGDLEYSRDLFDDATIRRLAGHFEVLLAGAAADPRRPLAELPLLAEPERAQLFREWNDSAKACPQRPLVHELFSAHARRRPDAPAVGSPHGRLTYGELERRSNRLAHHLRRRGVGPEVLVAICTERTFDRVVGIVSVLKAGGAYVSLDPGYPPERLAFLIADAQAPVLLTEERFAARLPAGGAEVLRLDADWALIEGIEGVTGDEEWPPASGAGPENLSYVVYTSGSTGKPKGVEIPHAGLMNLVRWHQGLYRVAPEDRGTQIASPAFDASIWELWPYLAGGASVHIPDEETRLSSAGMVDWWSQERITLAYLMTPLAEGVLEEEIPPHLDLAVRDLIIGGDRLHRGPDPRIGFRLMNHYGPAEYSVNSTAVRVPLQGEGRDLPTIGRPVDNTSIYLLDRDQQPVPVGVPGELYVTGVGLARGYLRRPELTAAKFVPDPWSGEPGARMYRTGDLVRYLPDGDMDFLGRLDHQVKLRGFRIELGEIETALGQHPGVHEAAVLVREDRPGDRRLVGYVTPAGELGPTAEDLHGFLAERLPKYMVPADWVVLAELPLTANGKVDRRALPAPAEMGSRVEAHLAPRGPVEEMLAGIWAEVLGLARVGVEDDFFALGGHSLLATQVTSRVRRTLGVDLPLRALFERPTIAWLAAEIERRRRTDALAELPPMRPVPRRGDPPMAFSQERMWFFEQLSPGNTIYNVSQALRLSGRLSVPVLAAALQEVVRRHEVLRTLFIATGGRPVQRIGAPWRPRLPVVDLSGLPAVARAPELDWCAAAEATLLFDLAGGRLLRCTLVRLGEDDAVLLLTLHHIVSDGWSMGILVRELTALYAAGVRGAPSPLPELPIQYADFAIWQRGWMSGEVLARELRHASTRLAGLPALELPTDRPSTAGRLISSVILPFALAEPLTAGLQALARRQGASLFMTLLSAIQALLYRHTGQEDFAIGAPVAGRDQTETEALIGFFVNTLVLRADARGDPSFAELLARSRATTLEAYDHQSLPFSRLEQALRPEGRQSAPFLEVRFLWQNQPMPAIAIPGVEVELLQREAAAGHTNYAISLDLAETGGHVTGSLAHNRSLFDASTATRWKGHLLALLAAAVEDPERRLGELPLLAEGERHQVLLEWSESGEVVLSGRDPAPIGIWGEVWNAAPDGAREPTGRRSRRRADGTLDPGTPAPEISLQPGGQPGGAVQAAEAPAATTKRLDDQARRLEKLSPAKRKLLEKRLRGEVPSTAGAKRAGARPTAPSLLVELQPRLQLTPGDRPPFFCVHAVGGAVLSYRELARALGPEQPFYGIQAAGLAGGKAVDDLPAIPAMAAEYAAAVEAAAPHGPYLLGGWSFGGLVAFEMACQMRARGRPVALVALLDSWAPAMTPMPAVLGEAEIVRLFLRDQAGLEGGDAAWLDEEPPAADDAAAVGWLLARSQEAGLLKASLRSEQVRPLLDVYRANVRAGVAYQPGIYAGRLTLFRPHSSPHPTNGWDALTGQPIEVHEMAADHYTMLAPPAVFALAESLGSCIERELGVARRDEPVAPPLALSSPVAESP